MMFAVALLLFTVNVWADRVYVVKRYDTLTGIAREHGVSLSDLARNNGLRTDTKVKVGQRLRIPERGGSTAAPPASALPAAVRTAIDKAPVKAGRWKHIVLHHSGTPNGNAAAMDRYHREERRMQNGLAYHFVIGNGKGMKDGEIAVGKRWTAQLAGGHLRSEALNEVAIGICLVGNFDQTMPTASQLRSLEALVTALRQRCKLPRSALKTHQQINPVYTRCAGRLFNNSKVLKDLQGR
jgi:N-acetyl-anhydromuramyl-L-alanine amidase AmpD